MLQHLKDFNSMPPFVSKFEDLPSSLSAFVALSHGCLLRFDRVFSCAYALVVLFFLSIECESPKHEVREHTEKLRWSRVGW